MNYIIKYNNTNNMNRINNTRPKSIVVNAIIGKSHIKKKTNKTNKNISDLFERKKRKYKSYWYVVKEKRINILKDYNVILY
jgi:hypothetical protein